MSPPLPPDRHFGYLFTVVFAALAVMSYFRGGHGYPWLAGAAGTVAAVTLARPSWLRPFNALWMRFAGLLHHVVSPVILGVIFFLVITPVGMVQRIAGRNEMRRNFEPGSESYWIIREPPGPPPESLRNQF